MAIVYPLNHPSSPGFISFEWKKFSNVGIAASIFTFQHEIQVHQGQAFGASVVLPMMNKADALEWESFIVKLNGMEGTFLIGNPEGLTARGAATGTPVVDGAAQVGGSFNTRGWDNNITNILRHGDYFQLGSGLTSRLHRISNDESSDGSGLATFDIWPDLREPPNDGAAIVVISPKGLFRMASNEMIENINSVRHHSVEFNIIEVVQ